MDTIIFGIDPSLTATGVVVLKNGEVLDCLTVKTKATPDLVTRVAIIRDIITSTIHKTVKKNKDAKFLCAIEGFSYGSKGRSVFDTGYLGWRIREDLTTIRNELGICWIQVPPSSLKLYATGKGNTAKELILQQVFKRWGEEFDDNNKADAYVLAQIGKTFITSEDNLTDFQVRAMIAIKEVNKE